MEMSQIRYVLAASKTLNFTKAARECNVTQPALTKAIKAIEAELGAPLFHRENQRILLSEFGRSILPSLQRIADGAEAAKSMADNYRLLDKVPIRLGVMSTVGHVRLSRFISQFEKDHDGVELSVSEQSLEQLKDNLEAGELDLAILNPMDRAGGGLSSTAALYGTLCGRVSAGAPAWRYERHRPERPLGRSLCGPSRLRIARNGDGGL